MAPPKGRAGVAGAGGASARRNQTLDYSNIGGTGRRTGLTLPDSGARDQHGLEPLDGIFSSPEMALRSIAAQEAANASSSSAMTTRRNGRSSLTKSLATALADATISDEQSMDLVTSSVQASSSTTKLPRRSILPPPRAKSPIKTNLGSSPRRSLAPTGTPARARNSLTPTRAATANLRDRPLSADMTETPAQTSLIAPMSQNSSQPGSSALRRVANRSALRESAVKTKRISAGTRRPFSLTPGDESDLETPANGDNGPLPEIEIAQVNGNVEDDFVPYDDDAIVPDAEAEAEDPMVQDSDGHDDTNNEQTDANGNIDPRLSDPDPNAGASTEKKKRGRPRKSLPNQSILDGPNEIVPSTEHDDEEVPAPETEGDAPEPAVKKRGRPPKNKQAGETQARPSKRPRLSPELGEASARPRAQAKAKSRKAASVRRSVGPDDDAEHRQRGPKFTTHVETPDEDGARHLKSGRISVKPIAYWKGEKIHYAGGYKEGKKTVLPSIKEVIRVEEKPPPPKPKRRRGARSQTPGRARSRSAAADEDDESEAESYDAQDPALEYEVDNEGVLVAEVMAYDYNTKSLSDIDNQVIELALSPEALMSTNRRNEFDNWAYTKALTLPFFHCGIVDISPGGEKSVKNARWNHMVFWVASGRVSVIVGGHEFDVRKGGCWQVPRGNFYAISNPYWRPARMFFAQGCYMTSKEGQAMEKAEEEAAERGQSLRQSTVPREA